MATAAIIGLSLAAVSAGVGAFSSIQQSRAQEQAADFNAAVARNDALAEQQRLRFNVDRLREKRKRILGAQRAKFAAAGIDPDSGSARAVRIDSENQSDLDIAAARFGGRRRISRAQSRANLASVQADNAASAGIIGAVASGIAPFGGQGQNLSTLIDG